MPRGKNRKPFKSNIAWVIPGVSTDCRKWESHGSLVPQKTAESHFPRGNLAEFFFFFI